MDYRAIFQISASGMNVEKLRLETAALNLANMHSTAASDAAAYRPMRVAAKAIAPDFAGWLEASTQSLGGASAQVDANENATPRLVHDPGHPHADAKGYVHYPGVDHTTEMITVMEALRAYEANVAAVGAARSMATRALEIGGQS